MDDLISRQAAIDVVMGFMPSLTTPDGCGQFDREIYEAQEMFVDIGQALNDLPSAERHGRWTRYEYSTNNRWRKCSVCGRGDEYINEFGLIAIRNYCPYCGAKMMGGKENE